MLINRCMSSWDHFLAVLVYQTYSLCFIDRVSCMILIVFYFDYTENTCRQRACSMPVHKLWSNYRLLDTWNDWLSVVTFAHLAWSATLKLWQVMKEIWWLARTWQATQVRVWWSIDMNVFIILMSMMGVIRDIECRKARYFQLFGNWNVSGKSCIREK